MAGIFYFWGMGNCQGGCGSKRKRGVCDVHRLVNGDTTERRVRYCPECKAWICLACWINPVKRAAAAALQLLGN